jgi:hypothetical protein
MGSLKPYEVSEKNIILLSPVILVSYRERVTPMRGHRVASGHREHHGEVG